MSAKVNVSLRTKIVSPDSETADVWRNVFFHDSMKNHVAVLGPHSTEEKGHKQTE